MLRAWQRASAHSRQQILQCRLIEQGFPKQPLWTVNLLVQRLQPLLVGNALTWNLGFLAWNVARLIPCRRHNSAVFTPASSSRMILIIGSSVKFCLFIVRSSPLA
jgi:hypothetical protein